MTIKLQSDGGKVSRNKIAGMRASDIIAYIEAKSIFGLKIRVEKVEK